MSDKSLVSRIYKELSKLNNKNNSKNPIRKQAKNVKRHLTAMDVQMEHQHKRCSASLTRRGMQIKTTVSHNCTPIGMAKIKRTGNIKYWRGYGETGLLVHCWWGLKAAQPPWKKVWRLPKIIEHATTISIYWVPLRCWFWARDLRLFPHRPSRNDSKRGTLIPMTRKPRLSVGETLA